MQYEQEGSSFVDYFNQSSIGDGIDNNVNKSMITRDSSFNFHNQNKQSGFQQDPSFRSSLNSSNIPTSGQLRLSMSGTKPPLKNRSGEKNPFDDGFGSNINRNSKQFAIAHMHQKIDKERNIKRRGVSSSTNDPLP